MVFLCTIYLHYHQADNSFASFGVLLAWYSFPVLDIRDEIISIFLSVVIESSSNLRRRYPIKQFVPKYSFRSYVFKIY